MAIQFKATKEEEERLAGLGAKLHKIKKSLSPYMTPRDSEKIDNLLRDFEKKEEKFQKEDRKLTLAVIGRVKAGKSSFLNELIFQGKDVLPHAFRPKTATLTKIEYDEEPHLSVEYYTPKEWAELEKLAKEDDNGREDVETAKELIEDVKKSGLLPAPYLEKGMEEIPLPNESSMESVLNEYVGANGKVTPLVKSVTLCIRRPELEGMSIVDTPGTNDPIISRTQTTKKFLAQCDVVFFLTTGDQALDAEDVDLLKAQLPGQGVGEIILLDSKFDGALLDASYDYDSLEEAYEKEKEKFTACAEKTFGHYADEESEAGHMERAALMRSCMKPLFLSSLMHRMAQKEESQYSEEERHVFENLDEANGDMTPEMVAKIGDMAPIEKAFRNVIAHKDEKLAKSLQTMIPAFQENIRNVIHGMAEKAHQDLIILENKDKNNLAKQKKAMEDQILKVRGDVGDQFSQTLADLEHAKIAVVGELHSISAKWGSLQDKTGTEEHVGHYRVSDSCLFNPLSWGRSHVETYTYTTSYKYVDASDALENLRRFAAEAQQQADEKMEDGMDLGQMKNRLLRAIVSNLDAGSADFNPDHMRLIVQETLNRIELPVFQVSIESAADEIASSFTGEVRDAGDRDSLKRLLGRSLDELVKALINQVSEEVQKFRSQMMDLQDSFVDTLLEGVNKEFDEISRQMADKEKSIESLKAYEGLLNRFEREI